MKIFKKLFEEDQEGFLSGDISTPTTKAKANVRTKGGFHGKARELKARIEQDWQSSGLDGIVNKGKDAVWNDEQYLGNAMRAVGMALEGMPVTEVFNIFNIHARRLSKIKTDQESGRRLKDTSSVGDPDDPRFHKIVAASRSDRALSAPFDREKRDARTEPKLGKGRIVSIEGETINLSIKGQSTTAFVENIKRDRAILEGKEYVFLIPRKENLEGLMDDKENFIGSFSDFKVTSPLKFTGFSDKDTISFSSSQVGTSVPKGEGTIEVSEGNVERALRHEDSERLLSWFKNLAQEAKKEKGDGVEGQQLAKERVTEKIMTSFEKLESDFDSRSQFGTRGFSLIYSMLRSPRERRQYALRMATKASASVFPSRTTTSGGVSIGLSEGLTVYVVSKKFYDFMTGVNTLISPEMEGGQYGYEGDENVGIDWDLVSEILFDSYQDLKERILQFEKLANEMESGKMITDKNVLEFAYRISSIPAAKAALLLASHFSNQELSSIETRVVDKNYKGFMMGNEKTALATFVLSSLARHTKDDLMKESNPVTFSLQLFNEMRSKGYSNSESVTLLTSILSGDSKDATPKERSIMRIIANNPEILESPLASFKNERLDPEKTEGVSGKEILAVLEEVAKNAKRFYSDALVGRQEKTIIDSFLTTLKTQAAQIGFNLAVLNAAGEA